MQMAILFIVTCSVHEPNIYEEEGKRQGKRMSDHYNL